MVHDLGDGTWAVCRGRSTPACRCQPAQGPGPVPLRRRIEGFRVCGWGLGSGPASWGAGSVCMTMLQVYGMIAACRGHAMLSRSCAPAQGPSSCKPCVWTCLHGAVMPGCAQQLPAIPVAALTAIPCWLPPARQHPGPGPEVCRSFRAHHGPAAADQPAVPRTGLEMPRAQSEGRRGAAAANAAGLHECVALGLRITQTSGRPAAGQTPQRCTNNSHFHNLCTPHNDRTVPCPSTHPLSKESSQDKPYHPT